MPVIDLRTDCLYQYLPLTLNLEGFHLNGTPFNEILINQSHLDLGISCRLGFQIIRFRFDCHFILIKQLIIDHHIFDYFWIQTFLNLNPLTVSTSLVTFGDQLQMS